jgi:DNA polymerase III alpha subunit
MSRIASIEEVGENDTYDLEVDHPDHQYYLANGVLTSNSHAISYSIISVQTAWLKKHYPAQFMCALLNGENSNSEKIEEYLAECKRLKISIVPPDVNKSGFNYKVIDDMVIATGLNAIKGLGPVAISELISKQPFKDFADFLVKGNTINSLVGSFDGERVEYTPSQWVDLLKRERISTSKDDKIESAAFIGKSSILSLAGCGALDSFGRTRKDISDNFDDYRTKIKAKIKQGIIFSDSDLGREDEEWERSVLLSKERDFIGHAISGDTHEIFKGFFKGGSDTMKFKDLKFMKVGSRVKVEGIVKSLTKEFTIKNGKNIGKKFAKYLIEDLEGNTTGLTLWAEDYEKYISSFKDGIPFKAICQVGEYMEEKSLNLVEMMEIFGIKNLSKK